MWKAKRQKKVFVEAGYTLTKPLFQSRITPDAPRTDILVLSVFVGKVHPQAVGTPFCPFEDLCKHFKVVHNATLKVKDGYWKFLTFKKGRQVTNEELLKGQVEEDEEDDYSDSVSYTHLTLPTIYSV
eukprot:TRINITY_DN2801_c0_g1_i1.p2 TRINITY_DN2801_c0_g1~~TRINITY_DN2801_c0_g1_i1.p2  ORF type:complete len:127 (-),score=30.67 TRINITY_DN2801_c0_g1_i1:37-417(-)